MEMATDTGKRLQEPSLGRTRIKQAALFFPMVALVALAMGTGGCRSSPLRVSSPQVPTIPSISLSPTPLRATFTPTWTLPVKLVNTLTPSTFPTSTSQPQVTAPSRLTDTVFGTRIVSVLDLGVKAPYDRREFDWSPDGRSLVLASRIPDSDDQLWIARAPDWTPQLLTMQAGHQPRWSPDGNRIAFIGHRQPDDYETLWLIQADGGALQDLLSGDEAVRYGGQGKSVETWLDEQTVVMAESCGTNCSKLVILDIYTGKESSLPEGGEQYCWSPDKSKYLAIQGGGIPQAILWQKANNETWSPTVLPHPNEFHVWSPDSRFFLFSHWDWEPGQGPPYAVTSHIPILSVWDVRQIQAQEPVIGAYQGTWSPDAEQIAFFLLGNPIYGKQGQLLGSDLVPGEPFPLFLVIRNASSAEVSIILVQDHVNVSDYVQTGLQDGFMSRRPIWSPDGRQLVFWKQGYGRHEWYDDPGGSLWIVEYDGSRQQKITQGLGVTQVLWSPDGSHLALVADDELYIIERPYCVK